jgi:F0F1-type ATP synthase assembly protein I
MLQAFLDSIFNSNTIFTILFALLGVIVFLKTIEKILIFLYKIKQRKLKRTMVNE